MPIDPELEKLGLGLLKDLGRVGLKAALTGLDSALSDVGGVLREGVRRVEGTRKKVRTRIRDVQPARPYTADDDDRDEP
jgi:hypothetical protein